MGKDVKIIIGTVIATTAIIFGGIFLTNRNQNKPTPTVNPSLLIKSDSYKITAPNEKVVLVEFGDLQCPACASYHPLVLQAREEFKDNLSYVFRNFPLPMHKNAKVAAYALEAAGKQAKYWEMQDKLYSSQSEWGSLENPVSTFIKYADNLKLDIAQFTADMESSSIKKKVENDLADGNLLGVDSTPTFYLNGTQTTLFKSYDDFKKGIEAVINKESVSDEDENSDQYHAHFDLKVVQNGKTVDFSLNQYQSTEDKELDEYTHVHDNNGKVVHIHKKDTTLGQLFKSLGFNIVGKLYVNSKEVTGDLNNYVPKDLDRILITDGNPDFNSVSNDACIYSESCPERGTAPPEACVGGLGTGCE